MKIAVCIMVTHSMQKKAMEEANRIEEDDDNVHIVIYEFEPYEEF